MKCEQPPKQLRRLKTIVTALAVIVLATACGKSQDVGALMAEGKEAQSKGDYKTAIIQFKNALQSNPDSNEARYLLGMAYIESGDSRSAEKELRKALELKKDPTLVLPNLARALLLQGEFEKVLDDTAPEKVADPTAELLSMRGGAQLSLGKVEDAKASFDQALIKSPGAPDALLGQARLLVLGKDVDGALKAVDQLLEKFPKHREGLMFKGDLLRLKNDNNAALAVYQKVIDAYRESIAARLNMASVYVADGKYDDAVKHLDAVRKISPQNPMAHYLQALVEFKQQNYVKAREGVQEVLKMASDHVPSQMLAGAIEYALGNYAQSEQYLKFVLDRSPNNLYARKLLTVALLRSRQIPRAIEVLQPALQQAPEDPTVLALAGEVYMQNNDFSKATQFYDKAAKIDPKNAQMRTGLGLSRLASGEADRAVADLEAATDLDANKYQADVMLIMTHLSRNEHDQADKAIRSLEKKQPDNPLTYNLRGAAEMSRKKVTEARKSFEKALSISPTYFPAAMNLAQLDLQNKNPQAARKHLEAILEKEPNHLQALIALAGLGSQINASMQDVENWLMRAKSGNPTTPQPALLLSRYHLSKGDSKKAMELALEASAISPDSPEVLDALGLVQLTSGEKNAAATTFGKLVSLQPKSAIALVRLANAQYASDNITGATASLKKALELKPDLLEALTAMVAIETRAKRYSEAMQIVKKVEAQTSGSPIGASLEGDVRFAEKQFVQAAAAYEKAYGISRSGPLAIKLHAALAQSSKFDEGEARLLAWLKDNPNDVPARVYLADAFIKRDKHKNAIEQYEWIMKSQPGNLLAMNNLAWAYQQVKDPRALQVAEQAYKAASNSAPVLDTYGWMLVEQGQTDKGLDLLQRATSLAPDAQEIRFHYASALHRAGKKDQARIELERILSSGVKFAQESEATALLGKLK
ncbi:MAG TPA: XrtA/PEP-CTERM system TPR-repeat protein PrsT [Burkholderiales bacterium]|nr:XrtA/PEP-CTERM system TPR-repeat protein PrsT [Burkholderiales bacterium]